MPLIAAGGVGIIAVIWILARAMNGGEGGSGDDTDPHAPTGWDEWEWRTIETIGTKDGMDFDLQEIFFHFVSTSPNAGWKPKSGSHRYRPVIINNTNGDVNSFLGIIDSTNNRTKADAKQALKARYDNYGGTGPALPPSAPPPQLPPSFPSGGSTSPFGGSSSVGTVGGAQYP